MTNVRPQTSSRTKKRTVNAVGKWNCRFCRARSGARSGPVETVSCEVCVATFQIFLGSASRAFESHHHARWTLSWTVVGALRRLLDRVARDGTRHAVSAAAALAQFEPRNRDHLDARHPHPVDGVGVAFVGDHHAWL